jgi:ankyrin repeat protein
MEEIAALVEAGADVNAPGELLNTPLHEAVGQGHIDAIRFLLEHGASPCAENELGDTPLAMAKVKDRADIMDLLRSWRGAKADEHARDRVRHEP